MKGCWRPLPQWDGVSPVLVYRPRSPLPSSPLPGEASTGRFYGRLCLQEEPVQLCVDTHHCRVVYPLHTFRTTLGPWFLLV